MSRHTAKYLSRGRKWYLQGLPRTELTTGSATTINAAYRNGGCHSTPNRSLNRMTKKAFRAGVPVLRYSGDAISRVVTVAVTPLIVIRRVSGKMWQTIADRGLGLWLLLIIWGMICGYLAH